MGFMDKLDVLFENKKYLYLMIVPAIIFVVAIISTFYVQSSIDLQGGVLVIMQTDNPVPPKEVENKIKSNFGIDDVKVTVTQGVVNGIQVQYMQTKDVLELENLITNIEKTAEKDTELAKSKALAYINSNNLQVEGKDVGSMIKTLRAELNKKKNVTIMAISDYLVQNYGAKAETMQVKEVAPTLGYTFYKTAIKVGILAFILVVIVVFICFRRLIPCLAVILSGVLDVLGGILGMVIVGVSLSLVTIPALLMLIGYSIDTDVMLTAKLLKQKGGSTKEKTKSALKTGLTMTSTTLMAIIVMLIISYIWSIPVLFDMSVVLTFGLLVDIASTWFMNAPILLLYIEKTKK